MTIDGYCTLGSDREYELTPGALLSAMDEAGVDRAVIAPVDRCLAVRNREGNDAIAAAAREYPSRLIPACSVNPWFGSEAQEELDRAAGLGARMLVLHPFVQGYLANDELVFPLLEAAAGARLPVYVHTGPPGNATPWHIVNLAERFPQLDFLMGHCGATDFWNDVIPAVQSAPNVYLESSLARPFQFTNYAGEVGAERCVVGSWAPLNSLVFEWEEMRKYAPPAIWDAILGDNLKRLLEKGGAL